jgi:GTP pyrophosphokinase
MFEAEIRSQGLSADAFTDEEFLPQLLKRVSFSTLDDLYAAIGYGGITATKAVNRMHDELIRNQRLTDKKTVIDKVNEAAERRTQQSQKMMSKPVHGVLVAGLDNCLIKFSRCCTPIPGDDIVGFITRGQGVSIHRADCANYRNRKDSPDDAGRWIDVSWAGEISDSYTTTIMVVSKERQGLVMDIATVLNALNAKVRSLNARDTDEGRALVNVSLEVKDIDELRGVMNRLASISGVSEVTRNGNRAAAE